jgi:GTP pyrophosphokinase
MHDHAEHGVAAHWAYKEAGTKGYAGVSATSEYDAKIAVLRQLLAWGSDLSGPAQRGLFDDRIYVLTPDAAVIELPQGATPVDFAYAVHTTWATAAAARGGRRHGAAEHAAAKRPDGGDHHRQGRRPSRDWLNAELGYLVSNRAKAKVRAWFNAQATHETMPAAARRWKSCCSARQDGDQAGRAGGAAGLQVGRCAVRGGGQGRVLAAQHRSRAAPAARAGGRRGGHQQLVRKPAAKAEGRRAGGGRRFADDPAGQMLPPAPPDDIGGFVTRGKGVSVHRSDCSNFREMAARRARDRGGLGLPRLPRSGGLPGGRGGGGRRPPGPAARHLRRVRREKTNVIGVQTQSVKGVAWMTFTVEVADSGRLNKVLGIVSGVAPACVRRGGAENPC